MVIGSLPTFFARNFLSSREQDANFPLTYASSVPNMTPSIANFFVECNNKEVATQRAYHRGMGEGEKGAVPDDLKDAIAENLRNYMRRELYDPESPDDIKRLAHEAKVHVRTLERLLRRDTYPGNQPSLKSLASLAAALRIEAHHLVYKPKLLGQSDALQHKKDIRSDKRNMDAKVKKSHSS